MNVMIPFLLILLSFIAILFSLLIEIQIFYNLKRFGFTNDLRAQKILNFFSLVTFIFIGLNLLFLSLNLAKK
jgi:hypothetical protein